GARFRYTTLIVFSSWPLALARGWPNFLDHQAGQLIELWVARIRPSARQHSAHGRSRKSVMGRNYSRRKPDSRWPLQEEPAAEPRGRRKGALHCVDSSARDTVVALGPRIGL